MILQSEQKQRWRINFSFHHFLNDLQSELKQLEGVLKQQKSEIEAIEDREAEEQSKLVDLKHELEKYASKMKENQQKIRHFQNEVCG